MAETPGQVVLGLLRTGDPKYLFTPSSAGGRLPSSDPKNPTGMQLVGADQDSFGGRMQRILRTAWTKTPLSVSNQIAVPLAKGIESAGDGVKRAAAGAQAALAGAGSGAASAGEGLKAGAEKLGKYAGIAVGLVIVFGALWALSQLRALTRP